MLQIDPVFYMVTGTVNPMLMNTGSKYFWSDVFNVIQRSCGVQCQVSALGVMLTGSLSQVTRAGEILEHQWRKHYQDSQSPNVDHRARQSGTYFNQHGTNVHQSSTNFNQHSTSVGNIYQMQGNTIQNQSGTIFNEYNKNFNEHDAHYTKPGTTPYQHDANFDQHGMTNSIRPGNFVNNVQNFDARFQNPLNQQHMNYSLQQRYQQPGLTEERQRSYGAAIRSVHSDTRDPGNALYGQGHHSIRHHGRCVNQSPHPPPGFQYNTTNPQQFENQRNIHPQHFARPPSISETNPRGDDSQRPVGSTRNAQLFPNPQNIYPQFEALSPCEGGRNPYRMEPPRSVDRYNVQQHQSVDGTRNFQPQGNRPQPGFTPNSTNFTIATEAAIGLNLPKAGAIHPTDGTKTTMLLHDSTHTERSENRTLKIDGMSTAGVAALPERFPNGTTNLKSPVNDQHNNLNPSTDHEKANSTTSCNQFIPPKNDTTAHRSETSPTFPSETTHKPASIKSQDSTTSSSSTESESASTSSEQSLSSSTDTTDFQSEKPPTSPQSTINHQLPANQQDGTTGITTPEAKIVTPSSNPFESPKNKQPGSGSEKPHGQPQTTINPQRQNNDQQNLPSEPENLIRSSNDGGSHLNELEDLQNKLAGLNLNKPTGEPQPESVTTSQQPRNDQEESINIPRNQPQLNQQQTSPNQQTTTLKENLNLEPSPKNLSASKPNVKPRKVIKGTEYSKDTEIPKNTPTPKPRLNKQGTGKLRGNAANFSNAPVKTTQTELKNLAPHESHTNSVKDDVNTTTKLNQRNEQRSPPPTKSDKNSVKDNVNTTTKLNPECEQRSPPPTKSDKNSVKDNVNTTTKPNPEDEQRSPPPTKSDKNSVKDNVNTTTKPNLEGEQRSPPPTDSDKNSVKENVNTTTKPNPEGEQRSPPTTESDKNSVKDNDNKTTKPNPEGEQRSPPPTESDKNSVKDNVNTTTKPNPEGEQRSPPTTESDKNSVKDNVNTTTKPNPEGEQRSPPPTESDKNSVKDNVRTTTKPNPEGEQRSPPPTK